MLKIFNHCYNRRSRIAVFMLILLLLPMLTGCKKRQDIVLDVEAEAENPEDMQEAEAGSQDDIRKGESPDHISGSEEITDMEQASENMTASEPGPVSIYVHICGAVFHPGVYELPAGSRVFAGIEAAGGLLETAYGDYVNQAEMLWDGEQLVIPTVEEIEAAKEDGTYEQLWMNHTSGKAGAAAEGNRVPGTGAGTASDADNGGKININTATESQLQQITGIGATRAAAIIQYREEHGSFGTIEDIMQVNGIKEGTYEKIKDEITVN